ncbi:MAG: hypothetical protein NTZ18_03695 [Candidatus Komeilibacteria bacterium]|nr:hypothetical protein [Candidatus Komeilibacteria bacterium]
MKKIFAIISILAGLSLAGTVSAQAIVFPNRGGTGITNYNRGDILYGSSTAPTLLKTLPIGTTGQFLQVNNGIPAWQDINNLNLGSFNAASTTATSTIQGNLHINGNLKVDGKAFFTIVSSGDFTVNGNLKTTGTTDAHQKIFNSTGALTVDQASQGNTSIILNPTTGNVGIGTTNPQAKLEVLSTTAQLKMAYDASHQTYFLTDANGDLNITPSGGDINFAARGNFATSTISATGTSAILTVRQGGAGDLFNAYDGNTKVFTILDGGKTGIGLSSPSAYLQVQGTTEQLRLSYNSSNYWSTTVNASGTAIFLATGTVPAFNLQVRDTTALTISDVQVVSNVPLQIAQSGDVGMAGNLILSNETASYIKAENPFYIETYSPYANADLTLRAANLGVVVIDDSMETYGTSTIQGLLRVATDTPVLITDKIQFNVKGISRTTQTSTTTCAADVEGSFFYNPNNKHFWGCDGTDWKKLD